LIDRRRIAGKLASDPRAFLKIQTKQRRADA
jgi:hypothetical protein